MLFVTAVQVPEPHYLDGPSGLGMDIWYFPKRELLVHLVAMGLNARINLWFNYYFDRNVRLNLHNGLSIWVVPGWIKI